MIFEIHDGYGLKMIDSKNEINEDGCSICFLDSEDTEELDEILNVPTLKDTLKYARICKDKTPICKHVYHTICLYKWIKESKRILCPICKGGLDEYVEKIPALIKTPPRCVIKYWDNGKKHLVYYEENGEKNGELLEYDNMGRLRRSCNYNKNEKDGEECEYYPYTNQVRSSTHYKLGVKHGKHYIKSSSGKYLVKCTYNDGKLHELYQEWYKEDASILKKVCNFRDGVLHGVMRVWSKEQILLFYMCYYEGKKRGRYLENYENGKTKLKCNYDKEQELDGIRVTYYKNGLKKEVEYFNHGIPDKYYWKQYSNQQIAKYGMYYNNQKDGVWKEWYRDGKQKKVYSYKVGYLDGVCSRYSDRGDIIEVGEYKNNQIHGKYVIFHPNGKINFVQMYENGEQKGQRLEYDRNGNLVKSSNYLDNKLEGEYIDYLQKIKCNYANGMLNGKFIQYTSNNEILMKGTFVDNTLHGTCQMRDENGQLIKRFYKYGTMTDC